MKLLLTFLLFSFFMPTKSWPRPLDPEPSIKIHKTPAAKLEINKNRDAQGKYFWTIDMPNHWYQWFQSQNEERRGIVQKSLVFSSQNPMTPFDLTVKKATGVIYLDFFFALKGEFNELVKIADNPRGFNNWVFQDINIHPSGDEYFVQLFPFKAMLRGKGKEFCQGTKEPKAIENSYFLELPYIFKFMTFERNSSSRMKIFCGATGPGWQEFFVENLPGQLLLSAESRLILFSGGDGMTFGAGLTQLKTKQWVYEILPLRLVKSQAKERIGIIVNNFQNHYNTQKKL